MGVWDDVGPAHPLSWPRQEASGPQGCWYDPTAGPGIRQDGAPPPDFSFGLPWCYFTQFFLSSKSLSPGFVGILSRARWCL